MTYLCECDGWCNKSFGVSIDEALWVQKFGYIIIGNTCENGPSEGDIFVRDGDGYKVYIPVGDVR
jgi:hypothetical protein